MRKIKKKNLILQLAVFWLVPSAVALAQTPLGNAFTYQGRLENAGIPVTDTCDFDFGLFEDSSGLSQVGATLSESQVDVDDGLFTVRLDFGSEVFDGDARWLEVAVQCSGDPDFTTLSPLQELAPAPYALALPGLRTQQDPTCPSVIGGYTGNISSPDTAGATISGGGTAEDPNLGRCSGDPDTFCAHDEDCSPDHGTCVPDPSVGRCSDDPATLCVIDDDCQPDGGTCVVPWTLENRISAEYATIGGGVGNIAGGEEGFRGSGSGTYSTIGGGYGNQASAYAATVGGGYYNEATSSWATVAGGKKNKAQGNYAAVGGGLENTATVIKSTVAGGVRNTASGDMSSVGGGENNEATNLWARVGGGLENDATASLSTVAGGGYNFAGADYSAITGGTYNDIYDEFGTIGGGTGNQAGSNDADPVSARYATVPGGSHNTASAEYSFAAGRRAKANHQGSFVWADSLDADFASTGSDQFLIRAAGGVGIGTNTPQAKLHIAGDVYTSGDVGIGTSAPVRPLHVRDDIDTPLRVESTDPITGIEFVDSSNTGMILSRSGNFEIYPTAGKGVGINRIPTTYRLEVDGNAGKTSGGSSWVVISDRRVKEQVETISDALNKLDRVRLVSFEYSDEYKAAHPDAEDRRHFNVVAQEFAEVFPDHVKPMKGILPNGGEALAVDIHPLTIYSAAAVQELHLIVNQQKEEISELRARLKAIEAMLAASSTTKNGGQP